MIDDAAYIMAAPNGARRGKNDHPNLPIRPDELAAEALRCRNAGAAALHMHVRDETGSHSLDPGHYRRAIDMVRDAVGGDLVIQITTEAVGRFSPEEQMATVRALRPEGVSIGLREILPVGAAVETVRNFFIWMRDAGIWAQLILYDRGDIERFVELELTGFFAVQRPSVLLVLGRYAPDQVSEPRELDPLLDALAPLRPSTIWAVCAFGHKENESIARALAEGGHARVGFENNLQLPDGSPATHTSDLVALAAESARHCGRPLMDATALRAAIREWM